MRHRWYRGARLAAVNLTALLLSFCVTAATNASAESVLLNEMQVSTTGTDWEFVEIAGAPGTPLSGLTLLAIESDVGSTTGRIDLAIALDGAIPEDGLWWAGSPAGQTAYGDTCGVADQSISDNSFENSSTTYLLVDGFTGAVGDDVDEDNDGVIDTAFWSAIVDGIAIVDLGTDFVYGGAVARGPDGTFLPSGVFRDPDEDAWSLKFLNFSSPDGTPGASNVSGCVTSPPTPQFKLIHEIQGDGLSSPLLGEAVTIQGVVVGDLQEANELDGFFMQEETSDEDGDPATSEGIFVYCGTNSAECADVAIGDLVTVTGNVDENNGQTQLDNDTGILEVVVDASDSHLGAITRARINFPLGGVAELEAFEGMAVEVASDMRAVEFFNFDRFSEIRVWTDGTGADRPYQVTQFYPPGTIDPDLAEEIFAAESVLLDDGSNRQNIGKLFPLNAQDMPIFGDASFAAGTPSAGFRGGDLFSGIEGVLGEGFGDYRIHLSDLSAGKAIDGDPFDIAITSTNPREAAPEDVASSLKVATLNVLNYFTTIDDGVNDICGPEQDLECRGADSESELARQQAKLVAALVEIDADIVGLIEIENTLGVSAEQTLVDALNRETMRNYAVVNTGVIGTDAIKVAFIYDADTVMPLGGPAVLDTPEFVNPLDYDTPKNRPALAQTFEEKATVGVLTVVVNHLKSKGSSCGPDDDDPEQGSCNLTRTLAAEELADWLATDPTGSGDADFLILGDLNSYAMEDPITGLKRAGYEDLAQLVVGPSAYSYVFDGRWGTLDYAMANGPLASQVTGVTEWPINADEPDAIDYDESFNPPAWFEYDAFRASDHDPVIVGLALESTPRPPSADLVNESPVPLFAGESAQLSFINVSDPNDPGLIDEYSFEIDCASDGVAYDSVVGDGTGVTLTCLYPSAGSYNAVGVIRDTTGLSSQTNVVAISVLSTADAFDYLRGLIDGLDGLSRGQTRALKNKLRNAERQYERDRLNAALAQLDALLQQLQNFADEGHITEDERLLVTGAVQRLIGTIM